MTATTPETRAATLLRGRRLAQSLILAAAFVGTGAGDAAAQSAGEVRSTAAGPGRVLDGATPPRSAPKTVGEAGAFVLPPAETLPSRPEGGAAAGPSFRVDAVTLIGANGRPLALRAESDAARALADGTLRAVAAEERLWRTEDVLELRDAITQLYIDAGYLNSGARIPSQDLADRELTIEIVEGALGETPMRIVTLTLSGGAIAESDHLRALARGGDPEPPSVFAEERPAGDEAWRPFQLRKDYVRDRINPDPTAPLSVAALQERFQLLSADPAIRRLDAALTPTETPGRARLTLDVVEAQAFSLLAGAASDRSPSIGGERAFVVFTARNPLGVGDAFQLEGGVSAGLLDIGAAYDAPLTANDLTAHLYIDYSNAEVVEDPLSDLDVLSQALSGGAGLSQPLIRRIASDADGRFDQRYELSVRGDVRHTRTETELLGQPFSFSPGADEDGRVAITAATGAIDGLWQTSSRVVAARLAGTVGLDATEGAGPFAPPKNFAYVVGQIQAAQRVLDALDHQLIVRLDGQYAPDTLFTIERLSFGGADSVRGYRRSAVTTDSGFVGSLEYRASLAPVGRLAGTRFLDDWSVGAFVDGGVGFNSEADDPEDRALLSAGAQLNFEILDRLSGSFYYGRQLLDVADPEDDALQDAGFGFRLTLKAL